MLRLDFSASDLNLAENREKTRRASISGVQDKVQLKRVRGGFAVVESGGDYVFANGDAHLKNFSLYRSEQGDYILTPAYDLLNTAVHFPNEPTATGLDFFADGHFTPAYEALGFYSSADFIELGTTFGVPEEEVCGHIARFQGHRDPVTRLIVTSCLSEEAKSRYLDKFVDRLRAIAQ